MSDPAMGLLMLSLIVVAIMLGYPTAFTLMGLGMGFGFFALYDPSQPWTQLGNWTDWQSSGKRQLRKLTNCSFAPFN